MKTRILIVEDENTARRSLSLLVQHHGFEALEAQCGEEGLHIALHQEPELILLDIRLPDVDGITILKRLRAGHSESAVIIMTADSTSSNAILATQLGAFDYIVKPINDEHLFVVIQRALEYRALEKQVRELRGTPSGLSAIPGMVGQSVAMQRVYKLIGRVASSDVNVLITGESGTGKELVAGAIHQFSKRAEARLVKVNCAAIPESLLEAELFGHERGAFTGANARRIGRFEQAHLGTLFLDEIGELQTGMQAKLLRALQDKRIERLGGSASIAVDFRLLAATARDLGDAVATADFREDLYYRLNVVEIHLPPLRARKEDIPLLVQRFLARSERPITIRDDALEMILAHQWPGNVRELENVISRAIVLSPSGVVVPESICFPERRKMEILSPIDNLDPRGGYWNTIRSVEVQLIRSALREAAGNRAEAARILGIQRRLLYEKLSQYDIA